MMVIRRFSQIEMIHHGDTKDTKTIYCAARGFEKTAKR